MKVLQIGKYYEPHLGGIENHVYNLCQQLKNKCDITCIAHNTQNKDEIFDDKGIKVIKAAKMGNISSLPISISLLKYIRREINNNDIIHIHLPNPLASLYFLISYKKNKKVVATFHSINRFFLAKIYLKFKDFFYNRVDQIIVTSRKYASNSNQIRKYKKKITIVPLGIGCSDYNFNRKRQNEVTRLKEKYGNRIVLFVGRLVSFKGVSYLIKAMKKIPDTNLLIIGNGNLKDKLRKLALNQKNIFFGGSLKHKDLVSYLHACDLLVLPSISSAESFGIVLLEAMMCGKPVISTEIGSGTSFVNEHKKTGLVVKPKNVLELRKAILFLLENEKIRKRMGTCAKRRVLNNFTVEKNADETFKIYKNLIGGKN